MEYIQSFLLLVSKHTGKNVSLVVQRLNVKAWVINPEPLRHFYSLK